MDNTLVGLGIAALTAAIYYTSYYSPFIYNMIVFYRYNMSLDPFRINNAPYIMNLVQCSNELEFVSKCPVYTTLYADDINTEMLNRKIKKCIIYSDIKPILAKLCSTYGINTLRRKDIDIALYCNGNPILPFAVSNRGHIVYYTVDYMGRINLYTTGSAHDRQYIAKYLINYIIKTFNEDTSSSTSDKIFMPTPTASGTMDMKEICPINKKKTFDTLFYPQKAELIRTLEKFKAGRMYPPHIPMDNKLGILLYGPPGTGKTGTISAIANMLGRNLVIINFAERITCKQLDQILSPAAYAKNIYVFDEFDCVLDVISGKPAREKKEEAEDWGKMLLYAEGEERKTILETMKQGRAHKGDASVDLAYLLQKLDGLESAENRIIIATTNNPDRINPALLRPGRFDIKICLSLCTAAMVVDILDNFYKGGREKIQKAGIPGGKYSPLQLINAAIQAPSLENLLKQLA